MKNIIHFLFIFLMACSESNNNSDKVQAENKNTSLNSKQSCSFHIKEEKKKLFLINLDKNWEKFGENKISNCTEEKNKFITLMSAIVFATFKSVNISKINEHREFSNWVLSLSDLNHCKPRNINLQMLNEILSCE